MIGRYFFQLDKDHLKLAFSIKYLFHSSFDGCLGTTKNYHCFKNTTFENQTQFFGLFLKRKFYKNVANKKFDEYSYIIFKQNIENFFDNYLFQLFEAISTTRFIGKTIRPYLFGQSCFHLKKLLWLVWHCGDRIP